MGKRGPAPKGEYAGKSKVLSTRIRPDTRAMLEKAKKESGRSLSQEIENRLRRTFYEDREIAAAFGDSKVFVLMRLVALALSSVQDPRKPDAKWYDDPNLFNDALSTIRKVLTVIRPAPSTDKLPVIEHRSLVISASEIAAAVWEKVQRISLNFDIQKATREERRLARLKSELGHLAERVRLSSPHDDHLQLESLEKRLRAADEELRKMLEGVWFENLEPKE